jgi:hypothetical protein
LDSELARKIETLTTRLDALEQRLGKVERHTIGVHSAPPQAEERPVQDDVAAPSAPAASPLLVPLIGRTSLVLAGAFLLRTLTETDVVPSAAGTALGIVYAILWLVMAYLAAAKGRRDSATFHGLASAIIAFPLLWEATVKFGFLSPVTSAGALVAFTSLGLGIATHKSLRRVAWVIALGAAVTALVLAVATKALVLFVACLLALGCATLWLGYVRGWTALGWLIATVVDAVVLLMTVMPLIGKVDQVEQLFRPASLVSLQLALVVIYVGSFLYRSIIESADVTPAEIAQGVAVLVIGLGGALAVTRATDGSTLGVGLVGLLLGAGSYGASFVFIDRRGGSRWNFVFYTTLALVFMLVGFEALLGDAALALAYAVVALVTAWLGGKWSRATLSLHGAVFASAAAVASGLLAVAVDAFTGPDVPPLDSSLSRVLMIPWSDLGPPVPPPQTPDPHHRRPGARRGCPGGAGSSTAARLRGGVRCCAPRRSAHGRSIRGRRAPRPGRTLAPDGRGGLARLPGAHRRRGQVADGGRSGRPPGPPRRLPGRLWRRHDPFAAPRSQIGPKGIVTGW